MWPRGHLGLASLQWTTAAPWTYLAAGAGLCCMDPHRRHCNIRSPLKTAWTMERLIFGNHKRQWSWIVYEIRKNNHAHVVCQGRSAPGCRMAEYGRGLTTENADTERSAQQRRIQVGPGTMAL